MLKKYVIGRVLIGLQSYFTNRTSTRGSLSENVHSRRF